MTKIIKVNEIYQNNYSYELTEMVGSNFDPEFKPDLTPTQMLKLGVFGGNYFRGVPNEFPSNWFKDAKISKTGEAQAKLNYFNINASQPYEVWFEKGWIHHEDPLGWFLWYCRYFHGRRIFEEDKRQIKRWKNMNRHIAQLKNRCSPGDELCCPRQRQALLHWAYDSRNM